MPAISATRFPAGKRTISVNRTVEVRARHLLREGWVVSVQLKQEVPAIIHTTPSVMGADTIITAVKHTLDKSRVLGP